VSQPLQLPAALAALLALAACSGHPPLTISYDPPLTRAEPIPEPPRPVEIVALAPAVAAAGPAEAAPDQAPAGRGR